MGATTAVLLCLVAVAEIAAISWCTLWPLRGELRRLELAAGWWDLYSFTLGNLDVWFLAVLKNATLLGLVLSTPARKTSIWGTSTRRDPAVLGNHKTVRAAIGLLCGLHGSFLLVKAAAVAVTAPEQLWPGPVSTGGSSGDTSLAAAAGAAFGAIFSHGKHGGGGTGGGGSSGGVLFVGLVYLFVSICSSLLADLLGQILARSLVSEREDAWEASEADEEGEPLRAPLLAEAGAAKRTAAAAAAAAAAGSGGEGAAGGGGDAGKVEGQEPLKKKTPKQHNTLWELLRLALPDWHILLAAFSAGVVAALGAATLPYLTGQIIDFASIEPDRSKFRTTLIRLVLVAAGTGVFTGTRGGLFTLVNARLTVRLRRRLFHALLQMEIGFFDTSKAGELLSRLSVDTNTVADQIGLNMNVLLRCLTQAAMVLTFMFAASWRLTVVTFIVVPVVLAISQVYGKFYGRMSKRALAEVAGANVVAEEVLGSMTTVAAHAAQDSAEAAYVAKLASFARLMMLEAAMYAAYALLTTFLPSAVSAVVLFYGGSLVLGGQMSPGALVSFMLYQQSLSGAFSVMGDVFGSIAAAVGAADKVIELMLRRPAVPPAGSLTLPRLEGRVELRDVSFHYPARPQLRVLSGMSLAVNPGEVVALVGVSGGGKSSIVKLLQRFYLPTQGRVLYDGHDLGSLDPKWLRRQVALVSQEPVLYNRSIRRNIVFGLEVEDGCPAPPSQEEVEEAAKQANAHDFIASLPEGYDTVAGDRGGALSGGQRQRVAIARALVRRPRVLLLDEATSALDADSEAVVQEALDRVMAGRTVLVIAHRLSTVQNADRIYVIGKGAVQEVGTHSELLAAGGAYSQLVRKQLNRTGSQASFLAGSSAEIRPSASSASLTSLTAEGSSPPRQQQQQQPQLQTGPEQQLQQQQTQQ